MRTRSTGTFIAATVVVVAVLLAASTATAAQWSARGRVGPDGYGVASVAFSSSGQGLLVLYSYMAGAWPALGVAAPAGDVFLSPFRLTRRGDGFVSPGDAVAVFGADGVIAAGGLAPGSRLPSSGVWPPPWVAVGRIGRQLGRSRALPIPDDANCGAGTLAVAADQLGDAAVLASGCVRHRGRTSMPLFVVARRAGQRFERPIRVTRHALQADRDGGGVAPVIAMNDRGEMLVAWADRLRGARARVWVRFLSRSGRRSRPQQIGTVANAGALSAQLGHGGRAAVAWWSQAGDWGGAGSGPLAAPEYFAATARRARFGSARLLERGSPVATPYPEPRFSPAGLAVFTTVDAAGRVRVVWIGTGSGQDVVRASKLNTDGPGPIQTLGTGALESVTTGPRGHTVGIWFDGERLLASVAPPGADFGAASQIAGGFDGGRPGPLAAAVDPRTNRVIVAWNAADTRGGLAHVEYAVREPLDR